MTRKKWKKYTAAQIKENIVRTRGKNPYIQDSAEWRAFEASREDLPARSVRVYPSMDAFLDDLEARSAKARKNTGNKRNPSIGN